MQQTNTILCINPAAAGASSEAVAAAVAAAQCRGLQGGIVVAADDSRSTDVLQSLLIRHLPNLSANALPTATISAVCHLFHCPLSLLVVRRCLVIVSSLPAAATDAAIITIHSAATVAAIVTTSIECRTWWRIRRQQRRQRVMVEL